MPGPKSPGDWPSSRTTSARSTLAYHADRLRFSYSLREWRDRALTAVAYDSLARGAELVALERQDFDLGREADPGMVLIRRAKKDPTGEGRVAWLAPLTVKLVRGWLEHSGITSGHLFRRIHGMVRLGEPLRPRAVAEILHRMARRAGLRAEACLQTTAHSSRVGAAQDLAAANTELPAIMIAGGWRDRRQVIRYTEKVAASRGAMARLARSQGRWEAR